MPSGGKHGNPRSGPSNLQFRQSRTMPVRTTSWVPIRKRKSSMFLWKLKEENCHHCLLKRWMQDLTPYRQPQRCWEQAICIPTMQMPTSNTRHTHHNMMCHPSKQLLGGTMHRSNLRPHMLSALLGNPSTCRVMSRLKARSTTRKLLAQSPFTKDNPFKSHTGQCRRE